MLVLPSPSAQQSWSWATNTGSAGVDDGPDSGSAGSAGIGGTSNPATGSCVARTIAVGSDVNEVVCVRDSLEISGAEFVSGAGNADGDSETVAACARGVIDASGNATTSAARETAAATRRVTLRRFLFVSSTASSRPDSCDGRAMAIAD